MTQYMTYHKIIFIINILKHTQNVQKKVTERIKTKCMKLL